TPVVDAVAVEPPVPNLPAELELTEDAMQAITERVSGKVSDGFAAQMELLRSTTEQAVKDLDMLLGKLAERITKLEAPMEEAVRQTIADMPRSTTKVVYRPTSNQQVEQPADHVESMADIAQATLANLKK
ncbi:MAG: hypothetical protein MUO64_01335, partial [Anaerolineales bacterium]|nr:hypothetical protein [Anaerolineales bacterium]